MAENNEQKHTIAGCEVTVRRKGKGEPLLFLHGAGGIMGWPPFLDKLAESYDVIAPDHPGFGTSEKPPWLDNIADQAYFYLDFLDYFDFTGVHLVGQSLGGWIAQEIAVRSTDRLKTLTLAAAAGIRIKGQPAADIFIVSPEELTDLLFHDSKFAEQAKSVELTEAQEDIQILNRVMTAKLGWQPRLFNPHLRKWLHRVDIPAHIIWGKQDKIIPPTYAAEFNGLLSGSKVTMIDNASHLPQVEQMDSFVDAVDGFIQEAAA